MDTSNVLKDFRAKLALSQSQVAELLRISRQTVSMIETTTRRLDTPSLIRLAELETMYSSLSASGAAAQSIEKYEVKTKPEKIKLAAALLGRMSTLKIQIEALRFLAEENKQQSERIYTWLQLLDRLLAEMPETDRENRYAKWLNMQQDIAMKQLVKYSSTRQKQLETEIEALSYEHNLKADLHAALDK
jgi:transcriptional regulator with XRE-family HTH domain